MRAISCTIGPSPVIRLTKGLIMTTRSIKSLSLRRAGALAALTALCLAGGPLGAQNLSSGGGGQGAGSVSGGPARGGPALAPPSPPSQAQQQNGATPTPLPGQSAFPTQLPPLNAAGLPQPSGAIVSPGSIPTRSATAAQAFGSLDSAQLGYVTRAQTDRIPGFVGFDNADTNRDGQLSKEELANAWRYYSGQ